MDVEEEGEDEEEEEEEEFTPSAWNATLEPHRSALRSPDKTLKSNVRFIIFIIRFLNLNILIFKLNMNIYICLYLFLLLG